jgi:hypothetical protein
MATKKTSRVLPDKKLNDLQPDVEKVKGSS